MIPVDELIHYGTPRHSGRYPWGSGEQPMQKQRDFLGYVSSLKDQGLTDLQIAKGMNISRNELQARRAVAKHELRQYQASQAIKLKEKNISNSEIGRQLGMPEASVRALVNPALMAKRAVLDNTAKYLKEQVDSGAYLDVGKGTENWLGEKPEIGSHGGISSTKMATAVYMLKQQGYVVKPVQVKQQFGKGKTTTMVLAPPGTTYAEINQHQERIKTFAAYTEDGGRTFTRLEPPVSVSSKRIGVRFAEQGGGNADGVIYVRPGVPDVSLGNDRYMQVRIAVDKDHYLKGMAMYKDDLPEGVDLLFNTNKHDTGDKLDAMKPSGEDAKNPFGTVIRQRHYIDADGKEKLSAMNIVNEEGNWRDWRPSLSSQVLSKQSTALARRQLNMVLLAREAELNDIGHLTNPVVKKKLLETFGDETDSAASHLKAAALPHQGTHVILPIQSLKENEVYAPNYKPGEWVALIRHPHGGPFEIPVLKVNNRNPEARAALGHPIAGGRVHPPVDAIGINPKVAKRLSGADFDGDAVIVIPNYHNALKTMPPLKGLLDFDPQDAYPAREGMKVMTKGMKQQHMGDISNLITDMTIKGAKPEEIARAVRHSMVVIDAEKHNLDFERSYRENGIRALKERYQGIYTEGKARGRVKGASTLISRAGSRIPIDERKPRPARYGGPIDVETGKKVYVPTGKTYTRNGKVITKQVRIRRLSYVEDATKLISDENTPMEQIYAAHANAMKALANQARFDAVRTGGLTYSPTAKKAYATEVASLNAKLNVAQKNAPVERQAQIISNALLEARIRDNPAIKSDPDELKKARYLCLSTARDRVGAKKQVIKIEPREWEAIQSGAITTNKLNEILKNANMENIKALATPRQKPVMTQEKMALAKLKLAAGFTQAEVASSLGIPVSTLNSALVEEGK